MTDRALGGRLMEPLSEEYVSAPRDEDDDLLEKLCAEAFDRLLAALRASDYDTYRTTMREMEAKIGPVRLRQDERTFKALEPLYAEEPRPFDKLRPLQYAEARRICLTYHAQFDPMTIANREALARADELIAKYSAK